jgi:uncharacterized repeat protein (TIGR03803 family)
VDSATASWRQFGSRWVIGWLVLAEVGCSAGRTLAPFVGLRNTAARSPQTARADTLREPRLHTIYTFHGGSTGYYPAAGDLVFANGRFYGTTEHGGNGCGVVFSLKPNAKFTDFEETTLYAFRASGDACFPLNGLVVAGARLYGASSGGGNSSNCQSGCGAVFSLPLAGGSDQVLYSFTGGSDGRYPNGPLTLVGSSLYGVTFEGGLPSIGSGRGTVFSVPVAGGSASILHSFAGGSDGAFSSGSLTYSSGKIYGTTSSGGAAACTGGCGTVFSVPLGGGADSILYAFKGGADGAAPVAGLTLVGHNLLGTTSGGNDPGYHGTVFTIPQNGGTDSILYSFTGYSDGSYPEAGVRVYKGDLYGTTMSGGAYGLGTVFRLPLAGGSESVLHSFSGGADQGAPLAGVIEANGSLYGTTPGVSFGYGTVFQLKNPDR